MILFVSGATKTIRKYSKSKYLGHLLTPKAWHNVNNYLLPWVADNGAFAGFDESAFLSMLTKISESKTKSNCKFVTSPDVVGDSNKTGKLFNHWEPIIRGYKLPVALVAQDGLKSMDVPWDKLESIFIGGSTDWKLGDQAAEIAINAKKRGKWLHMGRVNTVERLDYALRLGCDSVDGSGFSMFPSTHIPWALCQIHAFSIQCDLFADGGEIGD